MIAKISASENSKYDEIETNQDGSIEMLLLKNRFPNCVGIRYRCKTSGNLRGTRVFNDQFHLPLGVSWKDNIFHCVYEDNDQCAIDTSENERENRLCNKFDLETFDMIALGLPDSITDQSFYQYFSKFGKLKLCELKKNMRKLKSKGYGFLRYVNFMDQNECIRTEHVIGGAEVSLRLPTAKMDSSTCKRKLFITNITPSVSLDDILEYFSIFGKITEIFMPPVSSPYAFITFESQDSIDRVFRFGESHRVFGGYVVVENVYTKQELQELHTTKVETTDQEMFDDSNEQFSEENMMNDYDSMLYEEERAQYTQFTGEYLIDSDQQKIFYEMQQRENFEFEKQKYFYEQQQKQILEKQHQQRISYEHDLQNHNEMKQKRLYELKQQGYEECQQGYEEYHEGYEECQQGYEEYHEGYEECQQGYEEYHEGYEEPQQWYEKPQADYEEYQQAYQNPQQSYEDYQKVFKKSEQRYEIDQQLYYNSAQASSHLTNDNLTEYERDNCHIVNNYNNCTDNTRFNQLHHRYNSESKQPNNQYIINNNNNNNNSLTNTENSKDIFNKGTDESNIMPIIDVPAKQFISNVATQILNQASGPNEKDILVQLLMNQLTCPNSNMEHPSPSKTNAMMPHKMVRAIQLLQNPTILDSLIRLSENLAVDLANNNNNDSSIHQLPSTNDKTNTNNKFD